MFDVLFATLAQAWRDAKAYADAEREIWLHEQSRSRYTQAVQDAMAVRASWYRFSDKTPRRYTLWAYGLRWLFRINQRYNPYVWWRWRNALIVRLKDVNFVREGLTNLR